MSAVCLDASFVLEILLHDRFSERVVIWWGEAMERQTVANVPPLFHPEVTSAIRKRVYLKKLERSDAGQALMDALEWPVDVWQGDHHLLQRRAFELAARFNRPRAYGSQYLALAELLGCELWTADERLVNAVRDELLWVRWIGDAA